MQDRATQALVKLALEPEWETKFEPNNFGFRPGRSAHDAIEAIYLSIKTKPKWVLDADISRCFDKINHEALLKKINTFPTLNRLIKAWLKTGVFDNYEWSPTVVENPKPIQLKLDPGSKTTGIALVQQKKVVFAAELLHRGQQIKDALLSRRQLRRNRRNRKTRYRAARFLNRTRRSGWLAPSQQHRVDTIVTWVKRLRALAPVTSIAQELVRFDLQLLQNPEISGVEYQQGELQLRGMDFQRFSRKIGQISESQMIEITLAIVALIEYQEEGN